MGYYFADVKSSIQNNSNDTIDLIYDIELGDKALIGKIQFIGDKKFKDRKLRSIIVSEENRFWKFLSNKKFLDQSRIDLDIRLLRNIYVNKGDSITPGDAIISIQITDKTDGSESSKISDSFLSYVSAHICSSVSASIS